MGNTTDQEHGRKGGILPRLHFRYGPPDRLVTLQPAYFALVMATGIVAIAADAHAVPWLPTVLFWLNAAQFIGLLLLTVARLLRYPQAVLADIRNPGRGIGFLTIVAAFAVLGTQLVTQMQAFRLALLCCYIAAILLPFLFYGLFAAVLLQRKRSKPPFFKSIGGGWLVSVVAIQSVATLITLLPGVPLALPPLWHFAALVLWLAGGALYLGLITLILWRYVFLPLTPEDLAPTDWICMGAAAITALTGTLLAQHGALPTGLASFVTGWTLFYWSVATLWIPFLLCLGFWRYLIRGTPISYSPLYWGAVFPLGMYSICTWRLAILIDAPFLQALSGLFMVLAVAAWAATSLGFLGSRLCEHLDLS
ncbi:MAG: tellurite resistance/C4-dicarboxylate transporter family protein [Sphingomonadaceae bacterium]